MRVDYQYAYFDSEILPAKKDINTMINNCKFRELIFMNISKELTLVAIVAVVSGLFGGAIIARFSTQAPAYYSHPFHRHPQAPAETE